MSKEYLEAKPEDIANLLYEVYDVPSGICEQIKDMVQRLESIDNAKPSETLAAYEKLDNTLCLNSSGFVKTRKDGTIVNGNIEFNMDKDEHIDCKDIDEMIDCLETIKKALQRLELIDNADPSEALKKLDIIENVLWDSDFHYQKCSKELDTIEQALLKAQAQAKDKVFLKNIGNTKVRVPLVSIFNGLTQEKRFAYTEHIYYHWEEMKESLEAEIKTIKTEKENLELKAKEQEKVLRNINEKNVDILDVKFYENYKHYCRGKEASGLRKDWWLTKEEFALLKRYLNDK